MNKYLISLILFITLSISIKAQVKSPYSQYGIGNISSENFGQSNGMGEIGIGLRSNYHLNSINPASYTALDSMSVIYELGMSTGYNQIESNLGEIKKTDSKIDFLAIGLKANRFYSLGFGLMPMSRINYTTTIKNEDAFSGLTHNYYHGNGGLTKIYWDNSFTIIDQLNVGVSFGYVFGSINKVKSVIFEKKINAPNTKSDEEITISNFNFKLGAQYTTKIDKKKSLVFGVIYEPELKLNTKKTLLAGTTIGSDIKDIYHQEIIDTVLSIDDQKGKMTYPSSFGLGITFVNKDKLIAGVDFSSINWSSLNNENFDNKLKNTLEIKGGLEYIPGINSIKGYYKHVRYRMGAYYKKTNLEIKNQRINNYGISFGIGLPLRNTKTSLNISYKMGQRGTLNNDLIKETYGILSLNFSLSDIWFVKRKFK